MTWQGGQRGAQRRVGYNHLISNKREWKNCSTKNAQLVFNFEQTRTVTIFGEHGMMAHLP